MTFTNAFPAVILAGGNSKRMGFPKLMLAKSGKLLISQMYENMRSAEWKKLSIVVSNHEFERYVRKHLPNVKMIINPNPSLGMISSLRLAVDSLGDGAIGVLSWGVDHPLVKESTLASIRKAAFGDNIVIPVCDGRRGHPTWWGRRSFFNLRSSVADQGGRAVLPGLSDMIVEIEVADPFILANINTPADAEKFGLKCFQENADM